MSLDVTPYLEEAEADEYFATVLDTDAWEDATPGNRLKALKMATSDIDNLPLINSKLDPDQENAFPRTGQTEVPNSVKKACAELALALLDGLDGMQQFSDLRVSSEGYSSVRANYNQSFYETHRLLGLASKRAYQFLLPWLDVDLASVNITRK